MLPRTPVEDAFQGAELNAEMFGYVSPAPAFAPEYSGLFHKGLSKFVLPVAFAACCAVASLRMAIRNVVVLSAKKQMVGVAARGVVAAMKYGEILWYRANCQLISKPIGPCCIAPPATFSNLEIAIPVSAARSTPFPTAPRPATFIDFRPEALFERFATLVPMHEARRPALDLAFAFVCGLADWRRLAATALTKLRIVKRQLARVWYTFHVNLSLIEVGRTGAVSAAPGFLMPNYSTNGRGVR